MSKFFKNKTALVIGGNSGIGLAGKTRFLLLNIANAKVIIPKLSI